MREGTNERTNECTPQPNTLPVFYYAVGWKQVYTVEMRKKVINPIIFIAFRFAPKMIYCPHDVWTKKCRPEVATNSLNMWENRQNLDCSECASIITFNVCSNDFSHPNDTFTLRYMSHVRLHSFGRTFKPRIHKCVKWFANHLRMVCEPNARVCVDGTVNLRCAIREWFAYCSLQTEICRVLPKHKGLRLRCAEK